jgi:putative SOS response-associated peptidase YedK
MRRFVANDPEAISRLFTCREWARYRLSRRKQLVEEYFDSAGEEDWSPRYNVAPTQLVPVIRQHPKEPRRNCR